MRGNELRFVFLLTKLLVYVKLYSVENVKVFAHLLSGGDNDVAIEFSLSFLFDCFRYL